MDGKKLPQRRVQLIGLDPPLYVDAGTHEQHRLETVAEVIALVGVMIFQKVLSGREKVSVVGVYEPKPELERDEIFQFGRGKKNTVAAHCLPGQLKFNQQQVQTMSGWNEEFLRERGLKPLALSSKFRNVSARTDIVDVMVNQTDSLLETMRDGRGLKPTLERTVYALMVQFLRRRPASWPAVHELVWDSMNGYRLAASYAYEERLDDLRAKNTRIVNATNKLSHVERYLEVVQDPSFIPEVTILTGFLCVVRDVAEGFHY